MGTKHTLSIESFRYKNFLITFPSDSRQTGGVRGPSMGRRKTVVSLQGSREETPGLSTYVLILPSPEFAENQ